MSAVQSRLCESFCPIDQLCGFAFRPGDDVVPVSLGLIDQFFTVFLGIGHVFEGGGNGLGWIDVLELDRRHLDAGMVVIEDALQ